MYIFSNPMPSIKSMRTHDNRKPIETKYISSLKVINLILNIINIILLIDV